MRDKEFWRGINANYTLYKIHARETLFAVLFVGTLIVFVSFGFVDTVPRFLSEPVHAHMSGSARVPNTQTMDVLQAARNTNLKSSIGGGGVAVVDGTVLTSLRGRVGDGKDVVSNNGQISVYVVKEGDSLSQIAEMFDVTVNTIAWANDLGKERVIQPGQKLVILPISGLYYTVEKGDTLAGIAKQFGGDEKEIQQFNNIYEDDKLSPGMEIIIPGGELARMSEASQSSSNQQSQSRFIPTPTPAPSSSGSSASGYFIKPITGGVRTQGIHGYNGVDIGAQTGTPILAAAAGEVIISRQGGWNGGYGNYIVIRHNNGTQTLYAHNSSNAVSVGQYVAQGEVIGRVGSTGLSTGPHLHFEVRGASNPF